MSNIDTHTLPSDFLHGISASSFASVLACWAWNSSAIFLVASFQAWFASFSWTFDAFLSFTASFSFWMTVGSWQGVLTLSASSAAPHLLYFKNPFPNQMKLWNLWSKTTGYYSSTRRMASLYSRICPYNNNPIRSQELDVLPRSQETKPTASTMVPIPIWIWC